MALEGSLNVNIVRESKQQQRFQPRLCVLSTATRPAPACPSSLFSNQHLSSAIKSSCKKQPSSHIQWLKQNEQEGDHGRAKGSKKL